MTNQQRLKQLFSILSEAETYVRAIGKVEFDLQCCAPEDGMTLAGDDMAVLGSRLHKITHSKKYQKLLCELHENGDGLSAVQKCLIDHLYDDYRKNKNISAKLAFERDQTAGRAYGEWLSAKKNSDFAAFKPSLEKLIALTRQFISLRDEEYPTPYTACLDDYEKGGSEPQLDAFFAGLRKRIVPLLERIVKDGKPIREDFLSRPCPIPQQEAFSRYLLELQGLKKSTLVLMSTEHPFTTNFGPKDVRVTTHYYENDFISNIFSTLHEGGHALFMQNEPEELYENHADNRMSNAMHECISRFYENYIGRSEAFIHFVYPKLKEISAGLMDGVSERELYEGVNIARPSLIRTEADELSYSLHIMVRYELEKAFINGEISADEIPALWNAKYKQYLGIDVPDDAHGCLQDVHWTDSYGYFPSYALGNAYGAQILHAMLKDFDVYAAVAEGKLDAVLDWLRERVFKTASTMTPDQWIRHITGEGLNINYYLDYLEDKYTKLYNLK